MKWLFMNGCEYKSLMSAVTEFLTRAKMGQVHQLVGNYAEK